MVYAALSIAKWPVVVIFFMIFLFVYLYRQGRISKTLTFSLFALMLAFPLFVILAITADMDVGVFEALKAIAIRIFYTPSDSIYYYFEVFPEIVGYLYGRSIGKLSWIIGLEYFDLPNYIFQYRFPKRISSGSADAGFIGALHADFGMLGVLLGGFFIGILMQLIQVNLLRKKKTILRMALFTFLVFAFFLISFSALPVILVSNGVILALALPWMFGALETFLRKATEPHNPAMVIRPP